MAKEVRKVDKIKLERQSKAYFPAGLTQLFHPNHRTPLLGTPEKSSMYPKEAEPKCRRNIRGDFS